MCHVMVMIYGYGGLDHTIVSRDIPKLEHLSFV